MRRSGFYVEVGWRDLGRMLVAMVLVLAGRLACYWEPGALGLVLGVALWWAGVLTFLEWVGRRAMTADEWQSNAMRVVKLSVAASMLCWAPEGFGVGGAWVGQLTAVFGVLAAGIWVGQRMARQDQQLR